MLHRGLGVVSSHDIEEASALNFEALIAHYSLRDKCPFHGRQHGVRPCGQSVSELHGSSYGVVSQQLHQTHPMRFDPVDGFS
jgi:rRNA maturation protein Nop10